jgi:hypothetical protein
MSDHSHIYVSEVRRTNNIPIDMRGRLESTSLREIPASQDAMNALAKDTGGKSVA